VPPVPSFLLLLLPVYLCAQCLTYMYRDHAPAKFISPQLWTPITFFDLVVLRHNILVKFLDIGYRYNILTSRSLLLFCAVGKNPIFYEHPLHVPESADPSKIPISSTLDTCNFFFGLVLLHHISGKFLNIDNIIY
jgi:hypothetical protein